MLETKLPNSPKKSPQSPVKLKSESLFAFQEDNIYTTFCIGENEDDTQKGLSKGTDDNGSKFLSLYGKANNVSVQ